jgi:hypothetical protein
MMRRLKRASGASCEPWRIHRDVPGVRLSQGGNDAGGGVPVLLRVHELQNDVAAAGGRLLRVLLVWFGAVSAEAARRKVLLG